MPKASLVFNLPEEEAEFKEALEGSGWKYLVLDLLNHLRNETTHAKISNERAAVLEELRELIWHSIEDRKLKAD